MIALVLAEEPATPTAADEAAAQQVGAVKAHGTCSGKMPWPAADTSGNGECVGKTHGSFDSTALSLSTLQECAQYAKEKCSAAGLAPVYVSYDPSQSGTSCAWYEACDCFDEKTCAGNQEAQTATVESMLDGVESGEGSEAPVGAGDAPSGTAKVDDPNYAAAQQKEKDDGMPGVPQLGTVPDAEGLNMQEMREDPGKINEEAVNIGELQPSCPEDEVAIMREEWQCIALKKYGGLQVGNLAGFIAGSLTIAIAAATYLEKEGGKNRRKQAKGEGLLDGEEAADDADA